MLILLCWLLTPAPAADDPALAESVPTVRPALAARSKPSDVRADRRPVVDPGAMHASEPTDLPVRPTRASLQPYRDRLREVLAVPTWTAGPQSRQPTIQDHDPFALIEPLARYTLLFDDLPEDEDIVAARLVLETSLYSKQTWTRTHYKLIEDDRRRTVAVAFGIQQAVSGRGVAITSTDVLVLFEDERPSEVFISTVHPWGLAFSERHLELQLSGSGKVVGAVEREVYGEKAVDRMMIRTENDPRTTWDTLRATRTTWTRRD